MAMMECPRCSFTQPKDRYCANCGLDVETYKPIDPPVAKRLAQDPRLYVIASLLVFVGLAVFFYKTLQSGTSLDFPQMTDDSALEIAEPETANETTVETQQILAAETQPQTVDPATPLSARASAPGEPANVTPPAATAPASTQGATEERPAPPSVASQVQLQFFEFPRAALALAAAKSQVIKEGEQYRVLMHQDQSAMIDWLRRGRILPGSQSQLIEAGARLVAQFPLDPASGRNNGLRVEINIDEDSPVGLNVTLRGSYQSREGSETPISFITQTTMTRETSLLIFGLISHPPQNTDDYTAPPNSPLLILDSVDFTEKLSEFVVVLQLR